MDGHNAMILNLFWRGDERLQDDAMPTETPVCMNHSKIGLACLLGNGKWDSIHVVFVNWDVS